MITGLRLGRFLVARDANSGAGSGSAQAGNDGDNSEGGAPGSAGEGREGAVPNKFEGKTQEEILQAYMELEGKLSSATEQASRMEELENLFLQLLQSQGAGGGNPLNAGGAKEEDEYEISEEDAVNLFKDPKATLAKLFKDFAAKTVTKSKEQITLENSIAEQKRSMRETFYTTNKDLVGFELMVGTVSDMVQRANPNVHPSKLLPLVAKVAREEIGRIRGGAVTLPGKEELGGGYGARGNEEKLTGNQGHIKSLIDSRR